MNNHDKSIKLDLSSTMVEKGLDIAKDFLGKLILPPVEETGLLIKDQVSSYRFSNQIKILIKARKKCQDNGINPNSIPFKLLCPLLENASLEDDDKLQDTWATLISNLADPAQSVANHIFPYILSQISLDEWEHLDHEYQSINFNRGNIEVELAKLNDEIKQKEEENRGKINNIHRKVRSNDITQIEAEKLEAPLKTELYRLERERQKYLRAKNFEVYRYGFEDYQISNLIRLGVIKEEKKFKGRLSDWKLDLPEREDYINIEEMSVLVDEEDSIYSFTDLGEYFMDVCTEKRLKEKS